ncbi:ABC transporter ATP-binding protein [Microbaculum marinisediminis]|uniref:ABC transporter ATP-binding protein n=1 Tax=Microbaculum marinisediminis TaxID=2931392 RepID=A0AAW5R686_9HYPH|nr:ABC transporter ATP-binding protein [Microbaculum sp. A6E488]MCT8974030.1 ABC transporter ATP-binding protein [Microbaculum sp. A6E488]
MGRWGRRGTAGAAIAARLSFDNVSHSYDTAPAVDRVTLDIEPAEFVCLLGHSGCGKTTLLKLAAGLEEPSSGSIMINGQAVSGGSRFVPPEKRGVGLMFQDFALFPHLSILKNVMFGLTTLPRGDAEREALKALRRVGLEDYAELYPHALSGGEQQRVALARAIAPRPSVLLMDEPFSGLDSRLRDEVRDETLAVLRETRATCIIVTHDPEEAMRMADRIVLMRSGRLVQVGTASELYHTPVDLAAARFFTELNEIPGEVEGGRVVTPVGDFARQGVVSGEEVTVCVRPHGVRLVEPGAGVPGRLVARRFLGEVERLDIAVEGLDGPLKARSRDMNPVAVGSEVGVAIDEAAVLMFPVRGERTRFGD